ncbi:RecQ family ATP-dependent DNA helicase [Flavobacterium magnum]|uniref:ATP-dependent DNA helicase RecQ n=1 Tax=Flavobacterium magnum TaxID=2162713 RepID=A0A2S0RHY9_9FLAO|nr:ATP-dependent DNA helicase RecQ [Flavobacterium magnum]AWA31304.1 RecQ family ATP-dependent DNA helicase [Flavobacterium magnum]
MPTAVEILKNYWNHDRFRDLQQDIIDAAMDKRDTFALLPTGGGKSICFQVPALMQDGLCLVISPLVALMKDQVANLQKRNIKAIALTGGLRTEEVSDLLDNCQFGNYKFLYLSPERLQSDWIIERLKSLSINLIAIDEAHCVSQWGHDFRPAYLKIANLRNHFNKVPFMALTASATPKVQQDIISGLGMKEVSVFQKSFERKNIAYMVFETEDKLHRITQILKKNPEPSIIYVRNRKSCHDMSSQLQSLGFSATYYHGGLPAAEKSRNMQSWMEEKAQVIVATNAFGMGIDKGNVKNVIHVQLPENIESYYQEAGRAGRNEEKAFAVLLYHRSDTTQARSQFISVLPDKEFLTRVFVKLCNYLRIAYGEGIDERFGFNLNHFCTQYDFPVLKTYNALQFLDRQGVVSLSQEFSEKVSVQFLADSREVLRYTSLNPQDEPVILTILRNYSGIYDAPCALNLSLVSKKSGSPEDQILTVLKKLQERGLIDYKARSNDATLVFNEIREDEKTINRLSKYLEMQNRQKKDQLQSVLDYVTDDDTCRQRLILRYFGEDKIQDCGICSFCIGKNRKPVRASRVSVATEIHDLLQTQSLNSREIQNHIKHPPDDVIFALRQLLDHDIIRIGTDNRYSIRKT